MACPLDQVLVLAPLVLASFLPYLEIRRRRKVKSLIPLRDEAACSKNDTT